MDLRPEPNAAPAATAAPPGAPVEDDHLGALVRADQRQAASRSILVALPVNVILGAISLTVAASYGRMMDGLVWFGASTVMNIVRAAFARASLRDAAPTDWSGRAAAWMVHPDRYLPASSCAALLSGSVWACVALLCDGFTDPQAIFYIVVVCGIAAGAVTHGPAFASIPICFIGPPLLTVAGCLIAAGGLDRCCLAATVLLFLIVLIRASQQNQAGFREASRLKHEATALASRLAESHARSQQVAFDMSYRAAHDPLTGLRNRAGFMEEVERRVAAAPGPAYVMMLDLDGFKSVNDLYGHRAGDDVLVEVANRLRAVLSDRHVLARLGGDEFAIFGLVDEPSDADAAPALAQRLVDTIAAPFAGLDARCLGVSIGIRQDSRIDVEDMMVCADEALYAAKGEGRNRFRLFDEALRDHLRVRREIERDLARAIAEHSLEVWFQPIFGAAGSTLASFEALLRWHHPRHGPVPPETVVSAAGLAGLSENLFRFVLDEACGMIRMLDSAGYEGVWVAINVSPIEMSRLPIDEIVMSRLATFGLPAGLLELEITEETAMGVAAVHAKLTRLAMAGVRIAVDDFGVGYSSLAALRQLNVGRVKIDRCFVTGIAESADDLTLVRAVLDLGRALDFEVVAEGIETAEALRTLQAAGCMWMQGYLLGRPMPASAVLSWLKPSVAAA